MSSETPEKTSDGKDLNEYYRSSLDLLTNAVERAIVSSHAGAGRDAGARRFWASVLFTRLCTISVSILWLSPRSRVNLDGKHWDFGSVASMARNLFECALQFYYLGAEPVSDDEWYARLKVMQLHDCLERSRMFRAFNPDDPQLAGFEQQAAELKGLLQNNVYFRQLPEALRKNLLRAERACILTQDEILERMGCFDPTTRGYYRFLSSHAHSFPLAFYRMAEHNRGRGEENNVEKGYMASTLEFCADVVANSTESFRALFGDVCQFEPGRFDWNILISRRKGNSDHG